jgi:uncharacterized protein (TIGR03437 family)
MPDRSIRLYSRDVFARHDPFLAATLVDTLPASAAPASGALVNGATFRPGPVAPGSLATLFVSIAATSGVEVRFNDTAARLVAVTPNQINLQVPSGIAPGTANLRVLLQGVEVLSTVVPIVSSSPGLFLADLSRGDQPGAILNQDSNLNTAGARARRGEVIQIFATGAGAGPPRVFIAAESAEVVYSGLSAEFPGLWQINVRVPDDSSIAKQVPLFVIGDDGSVSNGVTIWVED